MPKHSRYHPSRRQINPKEGKTKHGAPKLHICRIARGDIIDAARALFFFSARAFRNMSQIAKCRSNNNLSIGGEGEVKGFQRGQDCEIASGWVT